MNILERIGATLSMNINVLLSKVENPVATLEKLIRDMKKEYNEARSQVAEAIADEKQMTKKHAKIVADAEGWEKKAELAVVKGDDELAKEALSRHKESREMADVYGSEIEAQRQGTEALKSALKALEAKLDEARRKKNILAAQYQRATAQKRLDQTMAGVEKTNKIGAHQLFDQIEDRIERMEAQAEAARELDTDNVELKFAKLEKDDAMNDELAALKERIKAKQSSTA